MFATALPRLAHAFAQPAVLAAGVATGVGVGAVGIGTGAIPVTEGGHRLTAIYECPGSNRIVARVARDQNVLVTARSADGGWFQIYLGKPESDRGWARTGSVTLPSPADALPVADCSLGSTNAPQTAPPVTPPNGEPSAVPLTAGPNPDGSPTLSHLNIAFPNASNGRVTIGCGEPAAVIEVDASDPDGINQVILFYNFRFQLNPTKLQMNQRDGNRWEANIIAADGASSGLIDYGVGALDNAGKSTLLHYAEAGAPELYLC